MKITNLFHVLIREKGVEKMKNSNKLSFGIVFLVFLLSGHLNPTYSGEWDNIPEKYKIETLNNLLKEKRTEVLFERCTEGVNNKNIPEEYKSYLYAIRAHNYLQGKELKEEMALNAGLDCIRSFHLNPRNYPFCKEALDRYFTLEGFNWAFKYFENKSANLKDVANAVGEKSKERKAEILNKIEKIAKEEKLEGSSPFLEKMRSEEIKVRKSKRF